MWHSSAFWSAAGSMINAVVVIALALINISYLKAANRQAAAAEEQASAARRSVDALERAQLPVLEQERQEMRAGTQTTLANICGVIGAVEKGQTVYALTLPSEWGRALLLLRIRRPDLQPAFDSVAPNFRIVQAALPGYTEAVRTAQGVETKQIAGDILISARAIEAALEKVLSSL